MSSAVKEKLQELEKEIKKYREDNATLHRLREEREKVRTGEGEVQVVVLIRCTQVSIY